MKAQRVLVVDDEPAIARALRPALEGHGFVVTVAGSGAEALRQVEVYVPDLILLDLGLPDVDGMHLTLDIRKLSPAPIIVLSVRGADADKIAALDNGADDYLTKPFSIGELMARIRVSLRRAYQPAPSVEAQPISIGGITLDSERHTVTVNGAHAHLSPTEFQLLEVLMRNAGKLITHRTLLHTVWGPEYASDTQLLRVYIGQLRGKVEERPERPAYIVTEPGIGYRFMDDEGRKTKDSVGDEGRRTKDEG
jgi:two-component system KDP operon response regulator KdpE